MKKYLCVALMLPLLAGPSAAQVEEKPAGSTQNGALTVYISSDDDDISTDFIRQEIPVISHVRDPGDAQVYIIITSRKTGAMGTEYTFFLIGQGAFSGMADTLLYVSSPDNTLEKTMDEQVHTLKMGLMRYVARTPMSGRTEITFTEKVEEELTDDRWNNWIIRLFLGGMLRGERTYKYSNIWGGFNTARVTEDWKIEFSADMGHNVDKYKLDEGDVISSNQMYVSDALVVKSLGEHWSAGAKAHIGSYTFRNYRLKYYIFPGIEYNIFPYEESTRKQVRFMYSTGPVFHHYFDTTIYNQMNEQLWGHRLDIAAEVIQKWGSLDAYLGWKNYFHDWSKNNLAFRGSTNIRIVKGLQIRFSGGVSMIHNQLSLVKGGASTEEILVRQKELATQYSFFTDLTIFYTFGSIYSSVVNPRFDDLNRW
jgi:hypothetical protein